MVMVQGGCSEKELGAPVKLTNYHPETFEFEPVFD
jgi:hypothetical protein